MDQIKSPPSIGIILLTYNYSSIVYDAIASLKSQTFQNWKCIIVDNGSTDQTVSVINKLISNDNRFNLFVKDNQGPSAGRNFGFSKLTPKTDYLHFLDGDDKLHPDFLTKMIAYLELNLNVGLLGCQSFEMNMDGHAVKHWNRTRYAPGLFGFPRSLKDDENKTPFETFFAFSGIGPWGVFRTSAYEKTTGYEDAFWCGDDTDIFCQMALISEVHYIPERLYYYRNMPGSLTKVASFKQKLFRDKWDNYVSKDEHINALIDSSLYYNYTRLSPLRDFRVAKDAMLECFKHKELGKLGWAFTCLRSGLKELIFRSTYKEKLRKRNALLKNN